MKLNEAIAKRLGILMREHGLNQYQLFKASGVPQSTISTILAVQNKTIKLDTIYDLCGGFKIELLEFFNSDIFNSNNIDD
ncbi:MAG: helix-turn-helix transcriptional regulator [Clostridia bacterium]